NARDNTIDQLRSELQRTDSDGSRIRRLFGTSSSNGIRPPPNHNNNGSSTRASSTSSVPDLLPLSSADFAGPISNTTHTAHFGHPNQHSRSFGRINRHSNAPITPASTQSASQSVDVHSRSSGGYRDEDSKENGSRNSSTTARDFSSSNSLVPHRRHQHHRVSAFDQALGTHQRYHSRSNNNNNRSDRRYNTSRSSSRPGYY
ncbi:MAG: hypothetical protein ACPG2Y_03025, partial [Acholeplasmataceae bacterium]